MPRLRALVLYWSGGGNTHAVAQALARGLESRSAEVTLLSITHPEAEQVDPEAYHLVCLGSPSYHFSVPMPMRRYIE